MGWFDGLRGRSGRRTFHLVSRIADDPQFVSLDGARYMIFHLVDAPAAEFRIKMLPTTPKRRKGERVELTYEQQGNGAAVVESMTAAPDPEAARVRNQEYLASIRASDTDHH